MTNGLVHRSLQIGGDNLAGVLARQIVNLPVRIEWAFAGRLGWRLGDRVTYCLEGSVFIAGAAVQWLRDGLGVITEATETGPLAASVPDSGGVYLVPAFTGLGSFAGADAAHPPSSARPSTAHRPSIPRPR